MTHSVGSARNRSVKITNLVELWPSTNSSTFCLFYFGGHEFKLLVAYKCARVYLSFCIPFSRETFLNVNRFRRKCNSFFVEFMWNFIRSKEQLTDNVLNKLMDYVSPSTEGYYLRTLCEILFVHGG